MLLWKIHCQNLKHFLVETVVPKFSRSTYKKHFFFSKIWNSYSVCRYAEIFNFIIINMFFNNTNNTNITILNIFFNSPFCYFSKMFTWGPTALSIERFFFLMTAEGYVLPRMKLSFFSRILLWEHTQINYWKIMYFFLYFKHLLTFQNSRVLFSC